jgi:hypothetical protein
MGKTSQKQRLSHTSYFNDQIKTILEAKEKSLFANLFLFCFIKFIIEKNNLK